GLDRAVESRRTLPDRLAGPEEVRQRGVVEARDDGGAELAAEVLRPAVVEQHRRRVRAECHPLPVELDDLAGVGRPDPGLDRRRRTACAGRQFGWGDAATGAPDLLEEPQLETEVDDPAEEEPAESLGQ